MTKFRILLTVLLSATLFCTMGMGVPSLPLEQSQKKDDQKKDKKQKNDDKYDVKKSGDTAHGYPPSGSDKKDDKKDKSKDAKKKKD